MQGPGEGHLEGSTFSAVGVSTTSVAVTGTSTS
jgi:hypothetical protein